ncbi:MAG: DUF1285 domain-containing protein [Alphaproteobacteria bacterium]|nr:DUF1285 domain-containing protein [Alphaproteobacteria bacterium]
MPKQDPPRKSLKELMRTGEGLSGFAWPETYSDFDIAILRDGTWTYQGDPIHRKKLCQLFATVLQRDEKGQYWLVTPGERGRITVEDAPFTAVEMREDQDDQGRRSLSFRTNLDYWVTADGDHAIRVEEDPETGEPSPYIEVRDGLDALILRPIFYDLVARAEEVTVPGGVALEIESAGCRFRLGRVPDPAAD